MKNVNFVLIVTMFLLFIVTISLKKIKYRCFFSTILIFGIVVCFIAGMYCFNSSFRMLVDIQFDSYKYHLAIIDNERYELPLPNKTAFNYRTSDTQAFYMTKTEIDDIAKFYLSIADDDTFLESVSNNKYEYILEYKEQRFHIVLIHSDSEKYNKFMVDIR